MKKLFLFCMTALLLFSNVRAEDNSVVVERTELEDNIVEVVLKVNESSNVCGGEFTFEFDTECYELLGTYILSTDALVVVNEHFNGDNIKMVFASASEVQGDLLGIQLKRIKEDVPIQEPVINVTDVSVSDSSTNPIETITPDTIKEEREETNTSFFETHEKITNTQTNEIVTSPEPEKKEETENKTNETQETVTPDISSNQTTTEKDQSSNLAIYLGIGAIAVVLLVMVVLKKSKK